MRRLRFSPLGLLCVVVLTMPPALAATAVATTSSEQRWDLRDLYPSPEAWASTWRETRQRAEALPALQANFGSNAASLRDSLVAISDLQRTAGRLGVYASLKADEDLRAAPEQERRQQAQALYALIDEKTAWVAPAILALGAERVRSLIAADAQLKARFDFYLEDALRNAPHTLGPEAEGVLAAGSVVLAQPDNLFQILAEAELPLGKVKLSNGKTVTLTQSAYEQYRRVDQRQDRKRVFDAFFGAWKKAEGTFGANLTNQVIGSVFTARARKFDDALSASLSNNNMPPAVYRTLVEQANAALPVLHRYLRMRKRLLGITGPLAYYDNYPPLLRPKTVERYDLERSKALTLAALAPMGDEYLGLLKRGFAASWADSTPRTGKASGAYVAGYAYDVHPYVLLNHTDDFESLSTFAHEWGHAVHTLLANDKQPFEKANYATFIAESASIANEMLLSDYMLANAKSVDEKLGFLTKAVESIRTTFFRQVMFAEFQLAIHQEVEQGRPLSGARLTQIYCGLAKRYYGEAEGVMTVDPAYCVEWAYISHFYRGYYVWQYATSMVGAAEFTAAIQRDSARGDSSARERFVKLLQAGGSDYPYVLYRQAGIDLATPGPYAALMARMSKLIDEIERLAPPR